MKHKVFIRRVEIHEREFIIEAKDKSEVHENVKLALEQDLAVNYLLAENNKRSDWIRPVGPATEEDIRSLTEMYFEKPGKD